MLREALEVHFADADAPELPPHGEPGLWLRFSARQGLAQTTFASSSRAAERPAASGIEVGQDG